MNRQPVNNPPQPVAPRQPTAPPAAPMAPQQSPTFAYRKGQLLLEGRPRLRAYGCQIIVALALTPAFGIGVLLLVGTLLSRLFTKYRVYENLIEFRTGIFFRKVTYVWLGQIEDMWLERPPCNILTGDATIHLRVGNREAPGGRLTVPGPVENVADEKASPLQATEILMFGLGNHRFMKTLFEGLRDLQLRQRHYFKGILTF